MIDTAVFKETIGCTRCRLFLGTPLLTDSEPDERTDYYKQFRALLGAVQPHNEKYVW